MSLFRWYTLTVYPTHHPEFFSRKARFFRAILAVNTYSKRYSAVNGVQFALFLFALDNQAADVLQDARYIFLLLSHFFATSTHTKTGSPSLPRPFQKSTR